MAPVRKKLRAGDDGPANAAAAQVPRQDPINEDEEERAAPDRRAVMADVARRRAAHFANFREEGDEEDERNIHAGGTQARTLGPWSSAVELINEREKAAEKRRDKLQEGERRDGQGAGLTQVEWRPRRDPALGSRRPCSVAPLRAMCEGVLVEYIDCVESLTGVPDTIRTGLAVAVCAKRQLTAEVAHRFASDAPSELCLPDCSQLDRDAMVQLIQAVATPRLERLELGSCGRGFGDAAFKRPSAGGGLPPEEAAEALLRTAMRYPGGVLPRLTHLKLGGAYRLNTEGLITVLRILPGLQHLAVPDALRLTSALLPHLHTLTPELRHADLGDCRGLDAASLATHLPQLKHLTRLVLDGIMEVGDPVLRALASGCPNLTHLSISRCLAVTDGGIAALAAGLPGLQSLQCNMCDKVTDKGLAALGAACSNLKVLSVQKLPKLSNAGLLPIIQRGTLERLCLHGASQLTDAVLTTLTASCHSTLQHLDISFCRGFSGDALGALVDACGELKGLIVFGCSQLGNRFAHGHSSDVLAQGGLQGLGTAVTA